MEPLAVEDRLLTAVGASGAPAQRPRVLGQIALQRVVAGHLEELAALFMTGVGQGRRSLRSS